MDGGNERRQRTRRRILERARRLFAEAGYESTSIEQVMRECGLTHGGFYAHFRSKLELYRAAMRHAFETGWPGEPVAPIDRGPGIAGLLASPELAFLAADFAHEEPEVRATCAVALEHLAGRFMRDHAAPAGLSVAAMLVGALAVTRASEDRSFRAALANACEAAARRLLEPAPEAPVYFWEPAARM